MSITDELREWWVRKFPVMDRELHKNFTAIADRIDAEHEKSIVDALLNDGLPMSDEVMADHGWVRLPLDADNVPIHIGDVMEWVRYEGSDQTIVRKVSGVGVGVFYAWSDEQSCYAQYESKAYRHHAPTVEDVLREFFSRYVTTKPKEEDDAIVAEFAAKLTLRGDE